MATARRLLKSDASPSGRDGQAGDKDAGSARSSATCATEDAVSRRPVRSGSQGFVFRQPPRGLGSPRAIVALLVLVALLLLGLCVPGVAMAKEWRIDRMDVALDVQQNSDVLV